MHIPPLLLLSQDFAVDYAKKSNQLFDEICLTENEELYDIINTIVGIGDGYNNYYCAGCGSDNACDGRGYASGRGVMTSSDLIYGFCEGYGFINDDEDLS